jgi:hypothetical protein
MENELSLWMAGFSCKLVESKCRYLMAMSLSISSWLVSWCKRLETVVSEAVGFWDTVDFWNAVEFWDTADFCDMVGFWDAFGFCGAAGVDRSRRKMIAFIWWNFYSVRNAFIGLASAAFNDCAPTVNRVTRSNAPPANRNTSAPMFTR